MKKNGFTLIELLIVIGIFIVLAAAGAPIYGNWQSATQLDAATAEITQVMRQAKIRSEAGYNDSAHGVFFEINPGDNDRFVLYQGSSFAARDTDYDLVTELDPPMTLATNLTNTQVNFSKGLGEPNATGTVSITHSTEDETVVVSLNGLGVVD